MAKRGRKPKSDYEKYLTAYKKASIAEMNIKSSYRGMAESAFTKAEFDSMINFYSGNNMTEKIKSAVTKQRYGISKQAYEGRKMLIRDYNIRASLKDVRRMSRDEFISKYNVQLKQLYHDLADDKYLSSKDALTLIGSEMSWSE